MSVLGAHHDHGQFRPLLLDARQDVEHVLVGHDDVGDDQVALPVHHPLEQGGGVARGADLIAEPGEGLAEHQPDGSVVVGD
jgi:hypothetical protein